MTRLRADAQGNGDNLARAADIFDEYGDFIFSIIRYQVRNDAQADDLFQDFFLSLVSKPMPQDIRNVKSFLYKMLAGDAVDAIRRTTRYKNYIRRYSEDFNRVVNNDHPEDDIIRAEEVSRIFELVEKKLPRRQAEAITLRYKKDYEINIRKITKSRKWPKK
jgi:RNA polymerase sigma factor (sigma-70 family)